uniref:DZF domain-containing protein n=1 Tax=Strongyloides papillosus TaxID=174720 RepID=A0A0N5BW42_STREA
MNHFPNRKSNNYQLNNAVVSSSRFPSNYPDNSLNNPNCMGSNNYSPIVYQQPNVYTPYAFNNCTSEFNNGYFQTSMSGIMPDSKSKYLSTIIHPSGGKSKSVMNTQRHLHMTGGNKKSRFFQANTNKVKGAQFHCDLCKVPCSDQKALDDHIKGKNHRRREALVNKNNDDSIKQGSVYKCEVCEVLCSSKDALISHVKGKAHEKQITNLKRLKLPIPQVNYNSVTSTKGPCYDPGVNEEKLDDSEESATKQVVGEEYIEEINCNITGKFIEYSCKLCECRFSDVNAKNIHLSGKRHHSSFRQKVNPSFNSEVIKKDEKKSSGKKVRAKNVKRNKQNDSRSSFLPKDILNHDPLYVMSFSLPVLYSLTLEDEKIYERCKQLSFSQNEMTKIDEMFTEVEKALANLSSVETDRCVGSVLKIKCIERVGILPCGIAINIDKEFDLNLVLTDYPTCKDFDYIVSNLPGELDKVSCSKWKIIPKMSESSILINSMDSVYSINLCITSPACRDSNISPSQAPEVLTFDSTNNILRKVRHFNWFEHYYGSDKDVKSTIQILRQISYKIPSWKVFNDDVYLMLLLFHTSISSLVEKLYPSGLLRRFFEMLASGLVVPKSFTIIDPCERDETNILKNLSQQVREDITNCAQHALRMMSFNKLPDIIFLEKKVEVNTNISGNCPGEVLDGNGTKYLTPYGNNEKAYCSEENTCANSVPLRKRKGDESITYPDVRRLKM